MKRIAQLVSRGVFSAGVAAALAFGAAQAVPAEAASAPPPPCTDWYCHGECRLSPAYVSGYCDTTTGRCVCILAAR